MDARDNNGQTPLHEAARSPSGEGMAELLVAVGAPVNAKNSGGKHHCTLQQKEGTRT